MGLLPVPDEVREMHNKIDGVMERMYAHERLLEKVLNCLDQMKTGSGDVKQLSIELEAIKHSLEIVKDSVRLRA